MFYKSLTFLKYSCNVFPILLRYAIKKQMFRQRSPLFFVSLHTHIPKNIYFL